MSETIGFIGLGQMGAPMARNLAQAGFALRVWNRSPDKALALQQEGVVVVKRPADAATPGGIVITMVADDAALKEVAFGEDGFAEVLGANGIHVSMSTIAPATTRELATRHGKLGTAYLSAPVFGRPPVAVERKLWICLAGAGGAKARVTPLLKAMSQGIYDYGEDAEAANVVKLAGNFMIAAASEAMAEAYTLAQKAGVDRVAVAKMFGETLFACPVYQNYGKQIAAFSFEPALFRLALGLKDLNLVLGASQENQAPMPFASLLRDRLLSSVAKGRSEIDWTGIGLAVAEDAGIEPEPSR
jgi:3-hydroxyisobutyrate dehydrogenase-like beta-hydroxyacid dehydrogenase